MTDEEADALGARLAACPRFKPLPGLRDMQGRTWEASLLWRWSPSVDRPDIREPATQGIVMALVREAFAGENRLWGGRVEVHQDSHNLFVVVRPEHDPSGYLYHRWIASAVSEEQALVAALEAAPA